MRNTKTMTMTAAITAATAGLAMGAMAISEPPARATQATALATSSEPALNLDTIKSLVGTWVAIDDAGELTEEVVSIYRTTAGGSAVLETLFPGTEHEMLTVYHMDNDELVMTHYCTMGNEPRMTARRGEGEHQLVFECADCDADGTNIQSDADGHMHKGIINFQGPDKMTSEWFAQVDGEIGDGMEFKMGRKKAEKAADH